MTSIWKSLLAALVVTLTLGPAVAPGLAFDGEKALHEAAKKEKEFTWYTAHYNSESAAALCQGFEKKYPGVKCNYIRTTAQVAYQRLAQDQKAGIAQVAQRAYLGEHWDYTVRPAGSALSLARPHEIFEVDEKVWLELDPRQMAALESE